MPRPDWQVGYELVTSSGEMSEARLMCRLVEAAVGNPAVSHPTYLWDS
jgi:hypothetical protein